MPLASVSPVKKRGSVHICSKRGSLSFRLSLARSIDLNQALLPFSRSESSVSSISASIDSFISADQSDDDCCNSCEEVRDLYRKKGWGLSNPDLIDQTKLNELSAQSTATDEEIFTQVLGPERPGRVRKFGLGPTSTDVFGGGI